MFYFELIDGELVRHDAEVFPADLELVNGADKFESYTYSRYCNNFRSWELIIEDTSAPKDHVFLNHVLGTDPNREFLPEDFDGKLIAAVEKQQKWEDSRGDFNNGFYVTLKLTEAGCACLDRVLEVLKKYKPEMVRL